jgi:hypothetical protein
MRRISSLVVILFVCFASAAWAQDPPEKKCCHADAPDVPTVHTPQVIATGCDRSQALEHAVAKIGDKYCAGMYDPKCEGTCQNQQHQCLATGSPTDVGSPTYTKTPVEGCKNNEGWEAKVPAGVFTCYCKCRLPLKTQALDIE